MAALYLPPPDLCGRRLFHSSKEERCNTRTRDCILRFWWRRPVPGTRLSDPVPVLSFPLLPEELTQDLAEFFFFFFGSSPSVPSLPILILILLIICLHRMAAQLGYSNVHYKAFNRVIRNKKPCAILVTLCFLLALSFVQLQFSLGQSSAKLVLPPVKVDCGRKIKELDDKRRINGKSWIVVTTINHPTDAMDLLCTLEGWNVSANPKVFSIR